VTISLITLSRLAETASYQANAAKLLAPFAPEASDQHIQNFRVAIAQINEHLAALDKQTAGGS